MYHRPQYDETAVLNMAEKLTKGQVYIGIKELFSKQTVDNAAKKYNTGVFILVICTLLGTALMIAVIRFLKNRRLHPATDNG